MNKILFLFGLCLIIIGLFLIIISIFLNSEVIADTKYAAIIMIGPFPIVISNNKAMAYFAVIAAVLVVLFIFIFSILSKSLW